MSDGRVNLPHLHERPWVAAVIYCANGPLEQLAVALDVGLRVVRSESEVQRFAAVTGGNTTRPGTEAVHEPRKVRKHSGTQDFDGLRRGRSGLVNSFGGGRHSLILAEE